MELAAIVVFVAILFLSPLCFSGSEYECDGTVNCRCGRHSGQY